MVASWKLSSHRQLLGDKFRSSFSLRPPPHVASRSIIRPKVLLPKICCCCGEEVLLIGWAKTWIAKWRRDKATAVWPRCQILARLHNARDRWARYEEDFSSDSTHLASDHVIPFFWRTPSKVIIALHSFGKQFAADSKSEAWLCVLASVTEIHRFFSRHAEVLSASFCIWCWKNWGRSGIRQKKIMG